MKVYLAAVLYNGFIPDSPVFERLDDREKLAVAEVKHILDSYHYVGNERMVKRIRLSGRRIFLDSGAFSAFTQGVKMDLDRYCNYIKANHDLIEIEDDRPLASVLDSIGDADGTYVNQKRMEEQGVCPLPCYHFGEPEAVVQYYAANYPYITIGGMVPISTPQLKVWLDRIWGTYLTNPDGSPKLKVHGFGLTSVPLMERYPWYSVDSSSWVQLGGMGNVFLPRWGTIAISEHAPQLKEAAKHIDNLPAPQQKVVKDFVAELGFNIDRMRKHHLSRKVFNMVTYGSFIGRSAPSFRQPQPLLF